MAKYRKKTMTEADPYKPGMEDGYHVSENYGNNFGIYYINKSDYNPDIHTINVPAIKTLEGWLMKGKGDYIVTGIQGERYPVKKDIFEATYEAVE